MEGVPLLLGNAQHRGKRKEQQDSFAISDVSDAVFVEKGGILAVLADGMGGMSLGREASALAVETMLESYVIKEGNEPVVEALMRSLSRANMAVVELARKHCLEGSVGTTMAAAVIFRGSLYWVSVGDSRIYLCRDGRLIQLTADHTYASELYEEAYSGEISWNDALLHPQRGALTSFLGMERIPIVDRNAQPLSLRDDDRVLLCSDGLYRGLLSEEIVEEMRLSPREAAERLVLRVLAKDLPHQDNVTAIVLAPMEPSLAYCEVERRVGGMSHVVGEVR
ncbi:PP2C family protein-serine/threonine phosphatase [Acetomicrobium sp. S15 = DSM 107314]|uniref:PP2C family protein-serine/threonine phosphatase n=1 Tax=Acetomicrobium sp. S15 = DSM 107314 TaxID=2529858 RepID=UPI0018E1AB41|nr:protein phosphatase 2C domain-containing protein [Acetomicrobium sp. S15 = DSM 107314]